MPETEAGGVETALHELGKRRRFGVTLGLARMQHALARLGDPHRAVPALHIAGTNGKGSTAAMSAAILRAAGYRVGLYTSPHLWRFSERVQVDGQPIAGRSLGARLEQVLALDPELSFFEVITLIAFCHFAASRADFAVIETGLGGRLDATNVIEPELSIITAIGLDHAPVLGPDLASIAREKAGIVKAGVCCVAAAGDAEVEAAISGVCRERNAPLLLQERDFHIREVDGKLSYRGERWHPPALSLGLRGAHQRQNAALVLAGVDHLRERGHAISEAAVAEGLAGVRWPGRLEQIGGVVLDCAHNPHAVRALVAALENDAKRYTVVLAALQDKAIDEMVALLQGLAAAFVFCALATERALDPRPLARTFGGVAAEDPRGAIALASAMGRPVLVTGSIYLVGEVRALLLGQGAELAAGSGFADPVAR